eukprot:TRINITY_DN616_c0_g1_i3.p1 TRINITY_DN616_c0_g1~~TRINITY_DN616_c0_g1_i3.p1  ORF type:complete len:131 (-),score=22.96 TRINITY_DN616_c0_g1_i3:488-880(-)
MVNKANELAEKYGYFKSDQFNNPANPAYHAQTTGMSQGDIKYLTVSAAEILSDFRGKRLDFFVSGTGTGGTLAGCSRTLKAAIPDLKIICAEHAAAPLLAKGTWASHPIQGWTPDFVPGLLGITVEGGLE